MAPGVQGSPHRPWGFAPGPCPRDRYRVAALPSGEEAVAPPADSNLRALSASTEQLLDSAPDGVVIIDEAGVICLVNRQAEALFGYTRDELIGQLVAGVA